MSNPADGPARLARWLEKNNETNETLASRYEVHRTTVSRIVNGRMLPTLALALALECDTGIAIEAWGFDAEGVETILRWADQRKRKARSLRFRSEKASRS